MTRPDDTPIRPGKILCIGRNYAAHVREMGDVAEPPAEPVVFLKPSTALVASGAQVVLPHQSSDVHHELELVAVVGKRGRYVAETDALDYIAAYALGLDLTARDIQRAAKASKGPWSVAKGFDTFAPLGPLTPASEIPNVQALTLTLRVNGEIRQNGTTGDMLFTVARLVSYLSSIFTLEPDDLIYTGTPEGVGPVRSGDTLHAEGSGLQPLEVEAVDEQRRNE